jgi:hypothetical protein
VKRSTFPVTVKSMAGLIKLKGCPAAAFADVGTSLTPPGVTPSPMMSSLVSVV